MTGSQPHPAPRRFGRHEMQSLVSLVISFVVMGALLFWPAGTFDWPRAWLFLGFFIACTLIAIIVLWRVNPEIFAARRKYQKGTKGWDAVVATLTVLLYLAILPVAALDYCHGWAQLPDWAVAVGYAFTAIGYAGTTWAQAVNRHFEPTVRIQSDRDHKVIDTGPYAFIRHPGYAFALFMATGIALTLGSLWALIPVVLGKLLLFGRTLGEEAVLREGLPGYIEYTKRVKYRWMPGVW